MKPLSRRTADFTDSVIRRMTRICLQYDAINLSQGFPDCNYSGGERRPRDKRACGNSFHDSMEGIHTLFFCGANVRHNA